MEGREPGGDVLAFTTRAVFELRIRAARYFRV
jgi:hypothetical protein